MELVKCADVLSKATIENSREDGDEIFFGQDEFTFCFKPDKAMTSKFADYLVDGPEKFRLSFIECR